MSPSAAIVATLAEQFIVHRPQRVEGVAAGEDVPVDAVDGEVGLAGQPDLGGAGPPQLPGQGGSGLGAPDAMLATVKHFAAYGGAEGGRDYNSVELTERTLWETYLPPYEAAHYEVSMKMGELSLLPKVRAAAREELVVADGTSCRHQIADGAGREAIHVARVLERALAQ